jgi:hypothetical protein
MKRVSAKYGNYLPVLNHLGKSRSCTAKTFRILAGGAWALVMYGSGLARRLFECLATNLLWTVITVAVTTPSVPSTGSPPEA